MLDRKILKLALGSHSKVPSEMLYLETGCLPLLDVITARRLLYLQTILKRPDHEVLKRVYMEQKKNPCRGDWVKLVEADLVELEISYNEEKIASVSEDIFKKQIMSSLRKKVFCELQIIQEGHGKVRDIVFQDLGEPQEYLHSRIFTNRLSSLLFNLRCRSVKSIKDNFHRKYQGDLLCPLLCPSEIDSQEHILACSTIKKHLKSDQILLLDGVKYQHIFVSISEQYNATTIFIIILKIQHRLLEKDQEPAYHGSNSGPIS